MTADGLGIYIEAFITPEQPLELPGPGQWRVEKVEQALNGAYVRVQKVGQGDRKWQGRRRGLR